MSNVYYVRMSKKRQIVQKGKLGFIGLGRVGGALLIQLLNAGYKIAGIYDINQNRCRQWARRTGVKNYDSVTDLAKVADVIFLTVPDQEIVKVYRKIRKHLKPKTLLIHCAGSLGTEIFTPLLEKRMETLALHPIQTFLNAQQAVRDLPGSYFALEGTSAGQRFGSELVRKLNGKVVIVRNQDRALYHTMCVFVSNFMNAIFSAAEEIGTRLGFSKTKTRRILLPLALVTLRNIINHGTVLSLTGPVRRGDKKTVRRHIQALKKELPALLPLYRALNHRLLTIVKSETIRSKK